MFAFDLLRNLASRLLTEQLLAAATGLRNLARF